MDLYPDWIPTHQAMLLVSFSKADSDESASVKNSRGGFISQDLVGQTFESKPPVVS